MDRKKVVYNICNLIQLIATVGFFIIFLIIAKEELTLGTIIGMLIIQILLETVCLVLETVKIAILGVEIIDIVLILLFSIAIATVCWSIWNCMETITDALDTYEQILGLYKMVQNMIIWNIFFVQKENYFFPRKRSFFCLLAEK